MSDDNNTVEGEPRHSVCVLGKAEAEPIPAHDRTSQNRSRYQDQVQTSTPDDQRQLPGIEPDAEYGTALGGMVAESLPVAIVLVDRDCTIRFVNAAFRDLTQTTDCEGRFLPELVKQLWGIEGIREQCESLLQCPPGQLRRFEYESTIPPNKTLVVKAKVLAGRELLLTFEDITEMREAELSMIRQQGDLECEVQLGARQLNRTKEELRGLTAHLFRVQEEERQRVARELHDDIAQRLALLEIVLFETCGINSSEEDVKRLASARELVHALNTDVRRISHLLHPAILNDLGLSAALKAMVKEFGQREDMPATYIAQDLPDDWSLEAATAIYRIAQEALRNVAKHAGKTHVKVILAGLPGRLQLRVMDFGVGFDQDRAMLAPGLGLISMQERARLAGGTLHVLSALGRGTTVTAEFPVEHYA